MLISYGDAVKMLLKINVTPHVVLSDARDLVVYHFFCNQHHLRELKSLIEHEKESWATGMSRLFRVALRCRHFHGTNIIPAARVSRIKGFNVLSAIIAIFSGNILMPAGN